MYHRRQKVIARRAPLFTYRNGRLTLSYTPVSNVELQRIIQDEYHHQQTSESSSFAYNNYNYTHKTPRFNRSILPNCEIAMSSSSVLANLFIHHNVIDTCPITNILPPMETLSQSTFSIINEQEQQRRSSAIIIRKQPIQTTTLTATNNNHDETTLTKVALNRAIDLTDSPLLNTAKKTTETVVIEDYVFLSASSIPCTFNLHNSNSGDIDDDNDDKISETDIGFAGKFCRFLKNFHFIFFFQTSY